jgi:hypothetical protein
MCTKMGPSFLPLYGLFEAYDYDYFCWSILFLYKRYIDDGIGVFDLPENDTINFLEYIGLFHPSIKNTREPSNIVVSALTQLPTRRSGVQTLIGTKKFSDQTGLSGRPSLK